MKNPIVIFEIENGDVMKAELYPEIAPNAVNNFIGLVSRGFCNGLISHKVINGFMIQDGCSDGDGMGDPGYSIKGEFSQNGPTNQLKHTEGVLSMARAMGPNSTGFQFFVMHKNSSRLDGAYAASNKVIEGMDVANEIANVRTDYNDRPMREQKLKSVTVDTFDETYPEPEECQATKRQGIEMREERKIIADGQVHTVFISDGQETLLTAHATGKATVGFWDRKSGEEPVDLSPVWYVVESPADVDGEYLERVVRQMIGLPWITGTTERLAIREFTVDDISTVPQEEGDTPEDGIFYTSEKLREYIRCQYSFYQYGIQALIRRSDGRLVSKAGVANYTPEDDIPDVELGCHTSSSYRNQSYAVEACREILSYVAAHLDCPIYARIDASNEVSIRVATSCGFQFNKKVCNGSGQYNCLYVWSC